MLSRWLCAAVATAGPELKIWCRNLAGVARTVIYDFMNAN